MLWSAVLMWIFWMFNQQDAVKIVEGGLLAVALLLSSFNHKDSTPTIVKCMWLCTDVLATLVAVLESAENGSSGICKLLAAVLSVITALTLIEFTGSTALLLLLPSSWQKLYSEATFSWFNASRPSRAATLGRHLRTLRPSWRVATRDRPDPRQLDRRSRTRLRPRRARPPRCRRRRSPQRR